MMKIGIDARIMTPAASGIGRYCIEMISALAAQDESREHQFLLFPGEKTIQLDLPDNWTYCAEKLPKRGVERAFLYPKIARRHALDRFYTTDYLGPVCKMPCKSIITVHDLIPIVRPELTTFNHRMVGRLLLPHCIKNATAIIAVSHFTKQDIVNHLHVRPETIDVVYNGIGQSFKNVRQNPAGESKALLDFYKIGKKPYLLFLGTLEPKKNLTNLVEAYSKLDRSLRDSHDLVLCGNPGWKNETLTQLIVNRQLQDHVTCTGFVEEEHLPVLLSHAKAFCFPSLYEGFGIPIIEAMACGCPVITSNTSSMPEIAGDATLLVDPYSSDSIAKAITNLLENETLRNDLVAKSQTRLKAFSWAEASVKILQKILSL